MPFFTFSFFGLAIAVFSPPCLSATLSFVFSVRFDLTLTSSLPPSVNADCDVVSSATFGFPDLPCLEAVAGPATARVSTRAAAAQQAMARLIEAALIKGSPPWSNTPLPARVR